MNRRPSGYEPDELPSCSTPLYYLFFIFWNYFLILTSLKSKVNYQSNLGQLNLQLISKEVPEAGIEPAQALQLAGF